MKTWFRKFFKRGWHPSSGDPALVRLFGGGNESSAGINVTPEEAIKLSAVHCCVKILSEAVAQLPIYLYRQIDENSKAQARDNPLYNLLLKRPNPLMSASVFKRTMMWNLLCDGNAYAQKQRLPDGSIIGLYPWDSKNVRCEIKGWSLNYWFRGENGQEVLVPPDEVFHLRDASRNGLIGDSVVSRAINSIGIGIAAEQYGAKFFRNDARPTVVLSAPGKLNELQQKNLAKSWNEQFGRYGKNGTAVLEDGIKPETIGIEPEQAQFLETRKFQVADIARFFRIPLHMLDDLDKSSFSNIEMQSLEFIIYTLVPWLTLWEEEIERSILNDPAYSVSFDVDQFLRGDIKSRYDAYAIGRQWGWLSVNDIRREEKMNPIDNGDVYLTPLNMVSNNLPENLRSEQEDENASQKQEKFLSEFGITASDRFPRRTNGNGKNHQGICRTF